MSLQFIIGRAGYDHFSKIMNLISKGHKKHPEDHYFYLVPNHIKFKSEIKTLEYLRDADKNGDHDEYAQINVQILSLTRMGWFFFNKQVMPQHQQISDPGVNMLLYTIIKKHADELQVFNHEIGQTGFILKIAQEISEMQTSQISADFLKQLYSKSAQSISQNDDFAKKMHDFYIIYKAYERAAKDKYISKAGILERLCDFLEKPSQKWTNYLKHCHFYISGFSQFTAQENKLVQILMMKSASVVIDLNIDRHYVTGKSEYSSKKRVPLAPYDLFYRPYRLYKRLRSFANYKKIPSYQDDKAKKDQNKDKSKPKRDKYNTFARKPSNKRVNSDLLTLEDYWIDAFQNHITPGQFTKTLANSKSVQVFQADNTYSELAHVAIKIRQMVATGKYRYSDFLILTRHLDKFSNVIKPIFHCQQIPVFNDLQHQMILHPLVRLIGDLFSIYHSNTQRKYTYRDVMDLLKTGLLIPKDDDGNYMDNNEYYHDLYLCENCVLQNGYWGDQWLQKKPWRYDHYDDFTHRMVPNREVNQRVNRIKKFVRVTLTAFFDRLDQAKDCQDAATDLYQFLVNNGVVDQLKQWRKEEINAHQLAYAGQSNQVWSVFCNLLDSCVDTLGQERFTDDFTVNDFWSLLKAGFESASYSQVPPTFDQVVISESKIVQMKGYKIVFMIGSTDDVMPDHMPNETLFSNTDRTELKPSIDKYNQYNHTQYYLNDGSKAQTNNEPYLNYLAFMNATQQVIFTFSLKGDDEDSGGIEESPYVKHLQKAFGIPTQHFEMKPTLSPVTKDEYQFSPVESYLSSPLGTLHHLVQAQYVVTDLNRHDNSRKSAFKLPKDWWYVESLLFDTKFDKSNGIYDDDPDRTNQKRCVNEYNDELARLTKRLLNSVNYKNDPKRIDPEIADQLYVDRNHADNLDTSISQLETFYRNPYEYFLKYGLRLKPRQIMGRSALSDFGQFYHAALKNVLRMIKRNNVPLTEFSMNHLRDDVDHVVDDLADGARGNKYEILQSSARMAYVKDRLRDTIWDMIYTIYLQAKDHTQLRPLYMELPFKTRTAKNKTEKLLEPLKFKVRSKDKKQHRIQVNGQIDRVDYFKPQNSDHRYYGIVDYKSSPHHFDYGQIFAGTQMQMMTYLDALYRDLRDQERLDKGAPSSHVFGALYSLVQEPHLAPTKINEINRVNNYRDDPWKLLLRQQQYNGLLIDDIGLPLTSLDDSLGDKKSSSVMYSSLKTNKDGRLNKSSQRYFITPDDFNVIRQWTEHKIKAAGEAIYDGDIQLKPAKWGNRKQNALTYSPYKSIMCFDPLLPKNKYNSIKSINTPSGLIWNIKNQQAEDRKDK